MTSLASIMSVAGDLRGTRRVNIITTGDATLGVM